MTVLTCDPNEGRILSWVPVGDLQIDPRYQRSLNQQKLDALEKGFDIRKFGTLDAALRGDGSLWVTNGGHRRTIALKKYGPEYLVPVLALLDTTLEDEAATFVGINDQRHLSKPQLHKAQVIAGDPISKRLQAILDARVLSAGDRIGPNTVKGVETLRVILGAYSDDVLGEALDIVDATFGRFPDSWNAYIIEGIARLIGTFGSHLDRDRLTDKLKRHGYDPDLGRPSARTLYGRVPTESGYGNGSRQRGPRVARWLATEYDKGLSEAKRLNLS